MLGNQSSRAVDGSSQSAGEDVEDGANAREQEYRSDRQLDLVGDGRDVGREIHAKIYRKPPPLNNQKARFIAPPATKRTAFLPPVATGGTVERYSFQYRWGATEYLCHEKASFDDGRDPGLGAGGPGGIAGQLL